MSFEKKVKQGKFDKLTEKEIEEFLDEHWLEWGKYQLSPMGCLTLKGKRDYIEGNIEIINELIEEFC